MTSLLLALAPIALLALAGILLDDELTTGEF
jgi:hypothetical protein